MAAMFFGLDLAWSDGKPSGVAALDRTGRLIDERQLVGDTEIVDWVAATAAAEAVIAADIPLKVPNATGRRPCEAQVAAVYAARSAGPHPSNRSLFMRRFGRIRGEDLAAALARVGFEDPWSDSPRQLLEVYPHPGLIEVFGLSERLRYKKGTVAERRRGLAQLSTMLWSLHDANPPLTAPPLVVDGRRGRALKALEDQLDARFCAWIASVWCHNRKSQTRVFGNRESGHIVVPVRPS